jgi:hypothetical protein
MVSTILPVAGCNADAGIATDKVAAVAKPAKTRRDTEIIKSPLLIKAAIMAAGMAF